MFQRVGGNAVEGDNGVVGDAVHGLERRGRAVHGSARAGVFGRGYMQKSGHVVGDQSVASGKYIGQRVVHDERTAMRRQHGRAWRKVEHVRGLHILAQEGRSVYFAYD